ncbi:hypothetical protein PMAYCL1PPCAC_04071, partial [Pristionchus mayeri]
ANRMSDSEDVVFVDECRPTSSKTAAKRPLTKADRAKLRASGWLSAACPPSPPRSASSVLLKSWIEGARRDGASTKRLKARRKAAGVSGSPAKISPKRSKIERPKGEEKTVETITLDDQDATEVKKEEKVEEDVKKESKFMSVTGSSVTAAGAILAPRSPNVKVSPANSQASQGSRSAPSICDEETQENDKDLADSQEEQYRALARACMRVDYDSPPRLRDGDVVRKRADRAKMHGQDCPCCSEYYDQLGMTDEERRQRINQVSRHRYVARPMPRTPPHYWDIDFPSEEEQRARGMINWRMESPKKEEIKDQRKKKEGEIKGQPEVKKEEVEEKVEEKEEFKVLPEEKEEEIEDEVVPDSLAEFIV